MLLFIAGMMLGGTIGIMVAALCAAARDADRYYSDNL